MSIGDNIYRLRTERNLSQGNLADELDVSRQSISKWETDQATPELDKLMKMCDMFDVTLDELTSRKSSKKPAPITTTLSHREILGYILIIAGTLGGVIYYATSYNITGSLLISLPFIISGAILLKVEKHPLYWCLWPVFWGPMMSDLQSIGRAPQYMLPQFILVAIFFIVIIIYTKVAFKDYVLIKKPTKKQLIIGWIVEIALWAALIIFNTSHVISSSDFLQKLQFMNAFFVLKFSFLYGMVFLLSQLVFYTIVGREEK